MLSCLNGLPRARRYNTTIVIDVFEDRAIPTSWNHLRYRVIWSLSQRTLKMGIISTHKITSDIASYCHYLNEHSRSIKSNTTIVRGIFENVDSSISWNHLRYRVILWFHELWKAIKSNSTIIPQLSLISQYDTTIVIGAFESRDSFTSWNPLRYTGRIVIISTDFQEL